MLGMPSPELGQEVLAVLRVSGARPVSVTGKVVRVNKRDCARPAFAVEFTRPSGDLEDLITDVTTEVRSEGPAEAVIVVARSPGLRDQLGHWLTESGWRVVGATTPLEAIAELERDPASVRWIVALDRLTQTGGTELLTYVSQTYPGVHRLLVSPPAHQEQAREAISEGVADAALLQPVGMRRLAEAVGKAPTLTNRSSAPTP